MNERAKKYLADILLGIELIETFSSSISNFDEYQKDLKTKSAIERQLGIVGETANQFRKLEENTTLSNIREIVNFRNRLIHSYDNIDDAIVWVILKRHMPILKNKVEQSLNSNND